MPGATRRARASASMSFSNSRKLLRQNCWSEWGADVSFGGSEGMAVGGCEAGGVAMVLALVAMLR